MTEALAAAHTLQFKSGKQNMASAAFAELRAARAEGRKPEEGTLRFGDLIDTLNPLQHIPVISELYRSVTGDSISPQARVAGGTLYGGPVGLMASIASLAIGGNGEDGMGDRILAGLTQPEDGRSTPAQAEERVAAKVAAETETAEIGRQANPVVAPPAQPVSVAREAAPMPRLSPEAFQALIGSFADPETMQAANSDLAAALDPALDEDGTVKSSMGDLTGAMQQALDKYEAMKSASATAGR